MNSTQHSRESRHWSDAVTANPVDREISNRFFSWLRHYGVPVGVSVVLHAILLVFILGYKMETQLPRVIDAHVGPYEARLVEVTKPTPSSAFSLGGEWDSRMVVLSDDDSLGSWELGDGLDVAGGDSKSAGEPGPTNYENRGGVIGLATGAGELGKFRFGEMGDRHRCGRAGLFGVNVTGNRVVYVIDFSGSVTKVADNLKRHVKRSISRLDAYQKFNVILFYGDSDRAVVEPFSRKMAAATISNRADLCRWIDEQRTQGTTLPLPALLSALRYEPDVIFFLSDGDFDSSVVDRVTEVNERVNARIACLLFDQAVLRGKQPAREEQITRMQRLAELNAGGLGAKGVVETVTPDKL